MCYTDTCLATCTVIMNMQAHVHALMVEQTKRASSTVELARILFACDSKLGLNISWSMVVLHMLGMVLE